MSQYRDLIGIEEVAELFGKSVVSIRKYKNCGILRVADKRGNKDLYDRDEVLLRKGLVKRLQIDDGLTLAEIGLHLNRLEQQTHFLSEESGSSSGSFNTVEGPYRKRNWANHDLEVFHKTGGILSKFQRLCRVWASRDPKLS